MSSNLSNAPKGAPAPRRSADSTNATASQALRNLAKAVSLAVSLVIAGCGSGYPVREGSPYDVRVEAKNPTPEGAAATKFKQTCPQQCADIEAASQFISEGQICGKDMADPKSICSQAYNECAGSNWKRGAPVEFKTTLKDGQNLDWNLDLDVSCDGTITVDK